MTTTALARHVRRCGVAPVGEQDQADHTAALLVQTAEVILHRILLADTPTGTGADHVAARLAERLLALCPAPSR
ncbi:hypothetical protein [Prauserella alba]|uniref:Uncharacterized protein n=1 Tax=Prauserella alba TaxID=176898 RepID=A0ABN1VEW7_9PSEU|nr:hypothetical protein [Prauserella alba]